MEGPSAPVRYQHLNAARRKPGTRGREGIPVALGLAGHGTPFQRREKSTTFAVRADRRTWLPTQALTYLLAWGASLALDAQLRQDGRRALTGGPELRVRRPPRRPRPRLGPRRRSTAGSSSHSTMLSSSEVSMRLAPAPSVRASSAPPGMFVSAYMPDAMEAGRQVLHENIGFGEEQFENAEVSRLLLQVQLPCAKGGGYGLLETDRRDPLERQVGVVAAQNLPR